MLASDLCHNYTRDLRKGRRSVSAGLSMTARPPLEKVRRVHNRRLRPLSRLRIAWVGAVAFCLVDLTGVAAQEQLAVQTRNVRVLVAVLPFRVYSAKPLIHLETALTDLLVSRLESSGGVDVVEAVTVREHLVAHAGERTEATLKRLAEKVGADYVVAGSLTELAGRYSLDIRVTPVGKSIPSQTIALTAAGEEDLLDRVSELSERILNSMGVAKPSEFVAVVRFEGVPEAPGLRDLLQLRRGVAYEREIARGDAAVLRDLPGVASASFRTERNEEGLVVVYRIVPETQIPRDVVTGPLEGETLDPVAEVRIEGSRRIEPSAIRARIRTSEGSGFDPALIGEDVRAIYDLGFFRDVRVTSEESLDGRILTFVVEENPVVRQVTIEGNESIDSDKIRDSLTLTTGSTLDHPVLLENQSRIGALYQSQGFYLADVEFEIQATGDDVAIHFNVTEGNKLKLREIVFEGNEHFTDEELFVDLKTRPWRWHSLATQYIDKAGTYAEPVFIQDLQAVTDMYQNDGYLQVDVGSPTVVPSEKGITVSVAIVEGLQYSVGDISITGDDTMDIEALEEIVQLKEGVIFNRGMVTNDIERLEQHYTDRGFYFAKVDPGTDISDEHLIVNVNFRVEKGPLHFIRQVNVVGNNISRDDVVRREVRVVEGELYSARSIAVSRARINSLGFFEEANFEPKQTDEPDQLDVDVRVVEKPTGALSFGAGFSSQDSFVITASVSQNNLFGRGYHGSVTADLGGRSQRFYLNLTDPYFLGSTFSMSTRLFLTEVDYPDFEQETTGFQFSTGHSLNEQNTTRGFMTYSYTSRDIDLDHGTLSAATIQREIFSDKQATSTIGVTVRSDTRNDRVSPTAGRILQGTFDVAGLGGFSKFVRTEARATFFQRMPEWVPGWLPTRDKSSAILGIRAGWTADIMDIDDWDFEVTKQDALADPEVEPLEDIDRDLTLPLSERYFLGGIGIHGLRGFKNRSIGPRRAIVLPTTFPEGVQFSPVGYNFIQGKCEAEGFHTFGGNSDGKCNSLSDEDIDDFDDLDETDVIGGNKYFTIASEYRFPVSDALGLIGILFFDMGNAFDETQNIWDFGEWRTGTGFGGLWFSPFGPLEAYVGFPLDKLEDDEDGINFEFSVGGAQF